MVIADTVADSSHACSISAKCQVGAAQSQAWSGSGTITADLIEDVLCTYLRMPYEPDPDPDAPELQQLAFQAIREVRYKVICVIIAHSRKTKTMPYPQA